jgi:hypothetical protein
VGASVLTDLKARQATAKERDYKPGDSGGLNLVSSKGHRGCRMKYRIRGKEKRLSFGPFPEVSLAEARDHRDSARKLLREHRDPLVDLRNGASLRLITKPRSNQSRAAGSKRSTHCGLRSTGTTQLTAWSVTYPRDRHTGNSRNRCSVGLGGSEAIEAASTHRSAGSATMPTTSTAPAT